MTDGWAMLRELAGKWHEVPATRLERMSTRALLAMTDEALLQYWEHARADTSDGLRGLGVRGWYHTLYDPWVRGRKVLEVGPGLGIDGVAFGRAGASMTYVDISESNLEVVERISRLTGLATPQLLHLQHFTDLDRLDTDYDAVFAIGSLHHMPSDQGKFEFGALARRLKRGGRFVMHAYPFQRWADEGRLPFDRWGEKTDGPGTPWAEWYDTRKLVAQLRPVRFAPVFYCEYRDGSMNCIDLVKIDGDPALTGSGWPHRARKVVGAVSVDELRTDACWAPSLARFEAGSAVITTAPEPWAYAASAPIHGDRIPAGAATWMLVVRATVREGRIGVAIATADGSTILTEEYLAEDSVEQECALEFTRVDAAESVIVRNASLKHRSGTVVVHSMDLFCLP